MNRLLRCCMPVLIAGLVPILPAAGQAAPATAPAAPAQPGAREPYKPQNLKVLPEDTDLRKVMRGYAGDLGVDCEFCHTAPDPVTQVTTKLDGPTTSVTFPIVGQNLTGVTDTPTNPTTGAIDLTTFATHTFGTERDALQTEHARTWLEAVVGGKVNEPMRWATYAIRSVDGLSATDLAKVTPTKDGGDDVRTVTSTRMLRST